VRAYNRLRLSLPPSLGGRRVLLAFEGSYTFTPLARSALSGIAETRAAF